MADAVSVYGLLDTCAGYFNGLSPYGLLFMHCAFCAAMAPDVKDRYLLHYWLTFAAGFGGGALSAIVLMRPDAVPVNFFVGRIDVYWTLAWWLVNYFPFDLPSRVLSLPPVRVVSKCCVNVLRSRTLCARITQTATFYPAALFAPLVMGTLGGSGGKFIHDMIRGGYSISTSKDELSLPSMSYHSSVFAVALYYGLVHLQPVLTAVQGTALITIILVMHGVIVDVLGVDTIKPLFRAFHLVSNIPQPMLLETGKKPATKSDDAKKKE